jgi:hypothetical protein
MSGNSLQMLNWIHAPPASKQPNNRSLQNAPCLNVPTRCKHGFIRNHRNVSVGKHRKRRSVASEDATGRQRLGTVCQQASQAIPSRAGGGTRQLVCTSHAWRSAQFKRARCLLFRSCCPLVPYHWHLTSPTRQAERLATKCIGKSLLLITSTVEQRDANGALHEVLQVFLEGHHDLKGIFADQVEGNADLWSIKPEFYTKLADAHFKNTKQEEYVCPACLLACRPA